MLAKQHRLRKTSDFNYILRQGKSISAGALGLKFVDNRLPQIRFGFLAASKVFKKAATRNRVKRKMREATRRTLDSIESGKDILLIARPGLEKESVKNIAAMVFSALGRARLLKPAKEFS